MDRAVKAADISDEAFLAAVRKVRFPDGARWATWWNVTEELGFPEKVVLAKARRLLKRNVLGGCGCGCRGDWYIVGESPLSDSLQ